MSDAKGWRWLYWIQLILAAVVWILITFTVPETYGPTILLHRARKLRASTGDDSWVTENELDETPTTQRLTRFLIRPFQLLFRELIVMLISLYMSVLYGLLYMFFVAFPIIYMKGKEYSAGKTGLMFIPVAVGVLCSAACSPWVNKHYLYVANKHNGKPPVDSYQHQAASALAAKTFIRSFWGAAVVLFTEQMYDRLGDQWASSLIAFISLACCAIPFLFWRYGAKIRTRSKYAFGGDEAEAAVAGDVEKAVEPVAGDARCR